MYKTLEDFKNEVVKNRGYGSLWRLQDDYSADGMRMEIFMEEVAILYAKYIQEETIKRCAENALVRHDFNLLNNPNAGMSEKIFQGQNVTFYRVDKQSILNIERILK